MLATCNVSYNTQNGNLLLYGEVIEDAIKPWTGYGNRIQSLIVDDAGTRLSKRSMSWVVF